VDRLEVRWPNGTLEEWSGVAVDRILTLREGTGRRIASPASVDDK
jgi:hypothetical protein